METVNLNEKELLDVNGGIDPISKVLIDKLVNR